MKDTMRLEKFLLLNDYQEPEYPDFELDRYDLISTTCCMSFDDINSLREAAEDMGIQRGIIEQYWKEKR